MRFSRSKAWPESQVVPASADGLLDEEHLENAKVQKRNLLTGPMKDPMTRGDTRGDTRSDSAPDGTLCTIHVRMEHIVLLVALGVCIVLWSRLCSISAKLALLEATSDLTKK